MGCPSPISRRLPRGLFGLLVAALAVGAFVGCSGTAGDVATGEDDIARQSFRFVDANPEVPLSAVARKKIQDALRVLARLAARRDAPALSRDLARLTVERIGAGDVLLGSIAGARGIDRWHMCKDYALPACKGAPPDPTDRTWTGDASLGAKLEAELAGYQWGNRVYFTIDEALDPSELAATLVHEVNHVANRSECHYYKNVDAPRSTPITPSSRSSAPSWRSASSRTRRPRCRAAARPRSPRRTRTAFATISRSSRRPIPAPSASRRR